MNVGTLIVQSKYKGYVYEINGVYYGLSINVPEIVRCGEIETYEVIGHTMVIKTKENKKLNMCMKWYNL